MSELHELEVYRLSETIADAVWNACSVWESFPKNTIGRQLVRAADSIGANIAEGYGRYAFRENVQFCYYARGSLMETRFFLQRAHERNLLQEDDRMYIDTILRRLLPMLNAYIRSIKLEILRDSIYSKSRKVNPGSNHDKLQEGTD